MIAKAVLLGLSTGPFCLCLCLPVLFPLACAEGERRLADRARLLARFCLGRLVAYLGFGALIGWLGGETRHPLVTRAAGVGLVLLALLLVAYGLVTGFPRLGLCSRFGHLLPRKGLPLSLGFLTGLNACPPFLMAAAYVFTLGRALEGMVFFGAYFLTTTLWLLPVLPLGAAARVESWRWLAQLSAVVAGLVFLGMGVGALARA